MIYAKKHIYDHNKCTIAARMDQPDPSWIPYDVPDHTWLELDANNNIILLKQSDIDARKAKEVRNALIEKAKHALIITDTVVVRTYEATLLGRITMNDPEVVEFMQYRKALRDIVDGTDTTSTGMPIKPKYPTNT